MKMKLMNDKKYSLQKFSRKLLVPKTTADFTSRVRRVTSLLHVNSLWKCTLYQFFTAAAGQKHIFMF